MITDNVHKVFSLVAGTWQKMIVIIIALMKQLFQVREEIKKKEHN